MNEEHEEQFSEDPIEHLKIENEILKMKLKAQFGDSFQMFNNGDDLPPDIENQFLKNMLQFEENYQNVEFVTVKEKIGVPTFRSREDIPVESLQAEIDKVMELLLENDIQIDFLYKPYNKEEVYDFITKDFLEKEIEKNVPEGTICNFIYEEFKPNHYEDIKSLTHNFILSWVTKNMDGVQDNLAKDLMDDKGNAYKEKDVVKKIENFFVAFDQFENDGFNIFDVGFQINNEQDEDSGFGHGEGNMKYDAVMENGEVIHYEGPYKIYFTYQFGYWYIFYFIIPGFKWS
jgi:hypothetical protein